LQAKEQNANRESKHRREDMHLTDVYIVSKDLYGNNGKILKKGYDVIAHNSIRQSILSLRYNIKTIRCIKC
jgi:hypothetical protein